MTISLADFEIIDDSPNPMVVADPDGVLVYANELAGELTGYTRDELVGLQLDGLLPEEFRASCKRLRQEFVAAPRVYRMGSGFEIRVLRKDGRETHVDVGLRPLSEGKHFIAVLRDISVSVALREKVDESEARLHAIATSSTDLVVEADMKTGGVVWYGDVDAALGYEPGEFPRTRAGLHERVHPDDLESIERAAARAAEGATWAAAYRVRRKDGSYRHWESRGQVISWEGESPKTLVGAIHDVTERVLREQALESAIAEAREQAELNESILNSFPSHIALLNGDGEIIAVNKAWTDFGAAQCSQPVNLGVGANYLEVCAAAGDEDAEAAEALAGISAILRGESDRFTMEYPCHSPDQERWFWMGVNPFAASPGAVMVHVDATDRILARRELEQTLQEVARLKEQLEGEHRYLQDEIKSGHNFEEIIGDSSAMRAMLETVSQVAETDATVLLLGETGTGKELVARAVHSRSRRGDRALIKVDCASIPSGLVESELFGHMKGSFTGAHESRPGRFELADKGTLFLDEIGELSADLQAKLLRVLQEGEIQRIGSRDVKAIDVRVIAATNRDLKREVDEGRFRADLYYRLNVFPIQLPPLRHRREDVPLLAAYFMSKYSAKIGKPVERMAATARVTLSEYDWPGNVRELRNVIERAVILSKDRVLTLSDSLGEVTPDRGHSGPSLKRDLEDIERQNIIGTLEQCGWKIKGEDNAASRLGLSPSTLRSRMKRLGIERRV